MLLVSLFLLAKKFLLVQVLIRLHFVPFHSKKSSSAHIGNWFVHACEQTVSKFVYVEFHVWKLLGNELNFQTVSNLCMLIMHPLHTNLILWKLFAHYLHTLCLPCNLFIANHLNIHSYHKILFKHNKYNCMHTYYMLLKIESVGRLF